MPYIGHTGNVPLSVTPASASWIGDFAPGSDLTRFSYAEMFADIPEEADIVGMDLDFSLSYRSPHTSTSPAHLCSFALSPSAVFTGVWDTPKSTFTVLLHDQIVSGTAFSTFSGTQHFPTGQCPTKEEWAGGVQGLFLFSGTDSGVPGGPGGTFPHDCEIDVAYVNLTIHYAWQERIEYAVTGVALDTRRIFSF